MTEKKVESKIKTKASPLIGAQAQPTTLSDTTRIDIDISKSFLDSVLGAGVSGNLDTSAIEDFTSISNSRDQIYQLIDTMAQDSSVASIVRTYTEDVCETADNGHIMWCESDDPSISKFVNYLLDVINVDKNIFGWTYSLIKYGDLYLRLFRESDYEDPLFRKDKVNKAENAKTILTENVSEKQTNESVYINIHDANDPYSYYVEIVPDPGTMFELTKYGKTYGYIETPNEENGLDYLSNFTGTQPNSGIFNYKMKSNDINVYQADDFVHACLDDNCARYPEKVEIFLNDSDYKANKNPQSYTVRRGKSLLYDSYKIWREKSLLENAALLNRITRSSVVRTIQVEVGDMPKTQVQNTLRRVKELMEQKSAISTGANAGMVEYNNPGPIENNIYLATHNGQGAVNIGTIGGDVEVKNMADLDYWNNKFYSSYGIPKQYFGWCLKFSNEVMLLNGKKVQVGELYKNREEYLGKGILGCNQDGSLCPTKIKNIILTNEHATKLIKITLDNGKNVEVTPDHLMMLRDGTFIRADEIKAGDSLMPYYEKIKNGRRYVLDNKLGKYRPLYHVVAEAKGEGPEVGYNIHHKNRIKIDDDFDNLVKLTIDEHCKEHNLDLAKEHKKANKKRKANGEAVNANVGGRYITNGIYYTTLKADEIMPEGFWYEGPKKPASMKKALSKKMLGKNKNYDNTSHLNTSEIQAKALRSRQETYDKLTGYKDFLVRCPECGATKKVHIHPDEYIKYLNKEKLFYCNQECSNKFKNSSMLLKSINLCNSLNRDINLYKQERELPENKGKYLKVKTLLNRLNIFDNYIPEINHKVVNIEYINTDEPVFDLTVEDDCHTFPLTAGIFVHNCDDGAGFNGGSSLTILSSVYAKGVKRVKNALIQAITDAINLILINKGCKSYLNNFVLKMKTPSTQEEKDYRDELTSKISAISNMQSLFSEVDDKGRKLAILKTLVKTLNYGDDLLSIIDEEIGEADSQKQKDAQQAEEEAALNSEQAKANPKSTTKAESKDLEDLNLNLADLNTNEGLNQNNDTSATLIETIPSIEALNRVANDVDNLPSPEEIDPKADFTKNE